MFCKYCNNEIRRVGNSKKFVHVLARPYNNDGFLCKRRPTPLAPDRAKRAEKSKPSASKRSKSGAAGKA